MVTLNESVVNVFENNVKDKGIRLQYIDQVWEMINEAYESQGGIKGSGFNDKMDMLNIPLWKMDIVDGVVMCVLMYKFNKKDKFRKLVALGTNTDPQYKDIAKKKFYNISKQEFKTTIMEVSGKMLSYLERNFPQLCDEYIFTVEEAKEVLGEDEILFPKDKWLYERQIGGEFHAKKMFGTKKLRY